MEPLRSPMNFFNHLSVLYFMINKIHGRFILYSGSSAKIVKASAVKNNCF